MVNEIDRLKMLYGAHQVRKIQDEIYEIKTNIGNKVVIKGKIINIGVMSVIKVYNNIMHLKSSYMLNDTLMSINKNKVTSFDRGKLYIAGDYYLTRERTSLISAYRLYNSELDLICEYETDKALAVKKCKEVKDGKITFICRVVIKDELVEFKKCELVADLDKRTLNIKM